MGSQSSCQFSKWVVTWSWSWNWSCQNTYIYVYQNNVVVFFVFFLHIVINDVLNWFENQKANTMSARCSPILRCFSSLCGFSRCSGSAELSGILAKRSVIHTTTWREGGVIVWADILWCYNELLSIDYGGLFFEEVLRAWIKKKEAEAAHNMQRYIDNRNKKKPKDVTPTTSLTRRHRNISSSSKNKIIRSTMTTSTSCSSLTVILPPKCLAIWRHRKNQNGWSIVISISKVGGWSTHDVIYGRALVRQEGDQSTLHLQASPASCYTNNTLLM